MEINELVHWAKLVIIIIFGEDDAGESFVLMSSPVPFGGIMFSTASEWSARLGSSQCSF